MLKMKKCSRNSNNNGGYPWHPKLPGVMKAGKILKKK